MRPITRRLLTVLSSEHADPVEFLDLRLVAAGISFTKRLTNAGEQVSWRGYTYHPVAMSRSGFEDRRITQSGSVPALTVTIQNIDRQFAKVAMTNRIEGARATYWQTDRTLISNPADSILLASGEVRNLNVSASVGSFDIEHAFALVDKLTFPKRWHKQQCNYRYGDQSCGVNLAASPNTITTTAEAGSTKEYVAVPTSVLSTAGSPTDPSEFWAAGTVWCYTGPNAPAFRLISNVATVGAELRFYFTTPFRRAITEGNTLKIIRGCRKSLDDCRERQGNVVQFGGFPNVPFGKIRASAITRQV